MTNEYIYATAVRQSAIDSGCLPGDFQKRENVVVRSEKAPGARSYLELPFICDLCSYGNNIVASVSEELEDIVREYINKYPVEHCFETPNLHVLMKNLRPLGYDICFMAEYFLPDLTMLISRECGYETRVLTPESFAELYIPEWSNALCEKRKHLDMLCLGAYDNGKLIGLAGASADCDTMWQIGIDVLPDSRRQGIAAALTSGLAIEIIKRGKVPFYCCAWSNIASKRNALLCGFRPAWVQTTAKQIELIEQMNI